MDVWPELQCEGQGVDSDGLRTKKRPRWEGAGEQRRDVEEMIEAWKKSISEKLKWYHPRSTSPMCEEALGKGESWLDEMERWIQGAREFVGYLEDQVHEWEGVKCRAGWKDYGMKDAEADEYLAFLRNSKAFVDQAVVVENLNARAVRLLRTLRTFNDSRKAFDVVITPESDDTRWQNGANKSTNSKTYRVTLSLWYFVDIFTQADLDYFGRHGGVRVHYKKLRKPWQKLFILRRTRDGKDELRPLEWSMIGGGPYVEVRTIELALDYTSNMTRYQILQPKLHGIPADERPGVLRKMLDEWVAVVTAVKKAQMQCTWSREWPPEDMLPWWPTTLQWMPVVCWVRKQDPKKQR